MISKVKQCVSLDFVMEAKNYASLFGIMLVDRRNGHKLGQTSRDGEGQGGLACCSQWGHKELDMTECKHTAPHEVVGSSPVEGEEGSRRGRKSEVEVQYKSNNRLGQAY